MSAWDMYWLLRLDGIKEAIKFLCGSLVATGIVSVLFLGIAYFVGLLEDDEDFQKAVKRFVRQLITIFVLWIVVGLAYILIPSTKQMAAIIVVPKIVNNEQVQEIPENLIELCNEWTKDKIKEFKGNKK